MPDTLTVTLPYPPTANTYYRRHGARFFISSNGKRYKRRVWAEWVGLGCPKLSGRIGVRVGVHCPDLRVRDLDNICKPFLDSLKGHFFGDDGDVDELHLIRCEVRRGGLLVVTLRELI